MQLLQEISEDEVIALFLRTEINSSRWKDKILEILNTHQMGRAIIDAPDITDTSQNQVRAEIFDEFRGYERRVRLFEGFPRNVTWVRAILTKSELNKVKYIDWEYWLEITGGTRLPQDAAQNIRQGKINDDTSQYFKNIAESIKRGATFPELILVGVDEHSYLVALEGHARLTGYFLVPDLIPEKIEVIIGLSPGMKKWGLY